MGDNGIEEAVGGGGVASYVEAELGAVHALASFVYAICLDAAERKLHIFFVS